MLWEQHVCPNLDELTTTATDFRRFTRPGGAAISANAGYAPQDGTATRRIIKHYKTIIQADDSLTLARTLDDVDTAIKTGRIPIWYDLEDSRPLDGKLENVSELYDLGVRTMGLTYNRLNAAGSGCLDEDDIGLTSYGRDIVREMNRIGMVVDAAHCSPNSGFDMFETSAQPVIYSHTAMRSIWDTERGITDEQAIACAETGGVIGVCGVSIFLAKNDSSLETMFRHIDHLVNLVGPAHVGIGSDYAFDVANMNEQLTRFPENFPPFFTENGPITITEPEQTGTIDQVLAAHGYDDTTIAAILGENFRRIAKQVWRA